MSGVVNESREVRPDWYLELSALFHPLTAEPKAPDTRAVLVPLRAAPGAPNAEFHPLDLQSLTEAAEARNSWKVLEQTLAEFWSKAEMAEDQWTRTGGKFRLWRAADITIGGIPFRIPAIDGYVRPLFLTAG